MVSVGIYSRIEFVRSICVMRSVVCRFVAAVFGALCAIWILTMDVVRTMVAVGVNARVKFIGNVGMMWPVVSRVVLGSTMISIRVVARIELVCCIIVMRSVVGRAGSIELCGCGAMTWNVSVREGP